MLGVLTNLYSMGGYLIADLARAYYHDGEPLLRRLIPGIIAFDTPYYGLNDGILSDLKKFAKARPLDVLQALYQGRNDIGKLLAGAAIAAFCYKDSIEYASNCWKDEDRAERMNDIRTMMSESNMEFIW